MLLAAILFCSALCAAPGQVPSGWSGAQELARVATAELVPVECAPADDHRDWRPMPRATASIFESAGKGRTLPAGLTTTPPLPTLFAAPLARPVLARAPDALSYLLHTPLLI